MVVLSGIFFPLFKIDPGSVTCLTPILTLSPKKAPNFINPVSTVPWTVLQITGEYSKVWLTVVNPEPVEVFSPITLSPTKDKRPISLDPKSTQFFNSEP